MSVKEIDGKVLRSRARVQAQGPWILGLFQPSMQRFVRKPASLVCVLMILANIFSVVVNYF